ncbi:hypothetical protein AKJ57_03380 [candidate division MSBL1 archaeon SCGC-AAA259A05]|uniref:Uncharacterized protein n=1 Tax=candidate division MSBL1 archaeon SCGC-AAA259A05 TaxID=1698259 RepID=A0A133U9J7_9EURY|nr:hypothetical protein AKJ57_03380 [candidate division MSBL1 archaeon SCGC-AAA259A05]
MFHSNQAKKIGGGSVREVSPHHPSGAVDAQGGVLRIPPPLQRKPQERIAEVFKWQSEMERVRSDLSRAIYIYIRPRQGRRGAGIGLDLERKTETIWNYGFDKPAV